MSTCARNMYRHEIKLIVKQILCIKLVKYWDKYTEMHGQQNVRTFFCFNAAWGSLHEDLRTFYCCRWREFATNALLPQHAVFLRSSQWRVVQQQQHNALLLFHCNNGYAKRHNVTHYCSYTAYIFSLPSLLHVTSPITILNMTTVSLALMNWRHVCEKTHKFRTRSHTTYFVPRGSQYQTYEHNTNDIWVGHSWWLSHSTKP